MTDRNIVPIEMIATVAKQLGDLCDRMTFLGGAIVGLLITDPASRAPRATKDVDMTIEIHSRMEFGKLDKLLRERGFQNDMEGPICRYFLGSIKIDVMPTSPDVIGFSNIWYPEAIKSSKRIEIDQGLTINLIDPACFLATKFEAFHSSSSEGHDDMFASQDFEDIAVLIDGRPSIATDASKSSSELKVYLQDRFNTLLAMSNIEEGIEAHLEPGIRSRVKLVMDRIQEIIDATI